MKRILTTCVLAASLLAASATQAGATSASTAGATSGAISQDMSAAKQAAETYDMEGLEAACKDLTSDSTLFMSYSRPHRVPRRAWRLAQQGMSYLSKAGITCQAGAASLDEDLISQSTEYLSLGAAKIEAASALM